MSERADVKSTCRILTAIATIFVSAPFALAETSAVAFAPVQCGPRVTAAEAEAYYQAILEPLSGRKDLRLLERKQLKTLLQERDMGLLLNPEAANKAYSQMAKDALADMVIIPAICKIENDFILSLRMLDTRTGVTRLCGTRRTRLVTSFPKLAAAQSKELFDPEPPPPSEAPSTETAPPQKDDEIVTSAALRQACAAAKADKLFPSLWERAEKLQEKSAAVQRSPQEYYLGLLNLCALATEPPPGMLFVPGGWVSVETSAGKRKLWIEPFFADRCEVTVAQYAKFVQAAQASEEWRAKMKLLTPITRGVASLNQDDMPVTGVTFAAAEACAAWRGARLPTLLQWLRLSAGDDERAYPCGAACKGINLKGADDGWETLAPAAAMEADVGPFGHVGLAGNVREWTATWIGPDAYSRTPADTPAEPATGTLKAQCGGSWRLAADQARCGVFGRGKPGEAADDIGFRCVMPFQFSAQDPNKTAQDARP